MTSGELGELLTICRTAVLAPEAVGENEMASVQSAPTARVLPQVLTAIKKSPGFAPVNEAAENDRVAFPILVSVTV
jgi:hypothetical protein